jgi:tripartite-type tricarboxylate transporter receptor subunit TctC
MALKSVHRLHFVVVFSALTLGASCFAQNQQYPSRPVRFIIPFPPGGGTDIVGRLVGQKLSDSLGQTFVMDNRPGAASTIGSAIAAQAEPDGYTLVMITASYSIAASYYKKLPYDPVKNFEAIGLVASQPLVLVTNPSLKSASVKELIAQAKSSPGRLNYASGGAGGINHLAAEMFKTMTGTRIVHVPYKGAGPALTGLISGETQLMFATLGSALRHIRADRLTAIALGSSRRSALLHGVPTVAESGVDGFEAQNWYGILAPRGIPKSIVAQLNRQLVVALSASDLVGRLAKLAFQPTPSTPREFAEYLQKEILKWARTMRASRVGQK